MGGSGAVGSYQQPRTVIDTWRDLAIQLNPFNKIIVIPSSLYQGWEAGTKLRIVEFMV